MMMKRTLIPAGVFLAVLTLALTASTGPVRSAGMVTGADMAPHRAVYEISLHQSREGVGPTGARGLMAYDFNDACEDWIVENRIVMDVVFGEETPVRTDWTFTNWEAKNGKTFGFHLVHKRNGRLAEELKGKARLDADGGGEAEFEGEAAKKIDLPPGTLFPTHHLMAMLNAARSGKKTFSRPVFDGGSPANPYDTSVYVVRPRDRDPAARALVTEAGFAPDLPVWRFQAAFFAHAGKEETPVFELEVDYRLDGIAERIVQYFGDFSILMTPVKIEPLKGGC